LIDAPLFIQFLRYLNFILSFERERFEHASNDIHFICWSWLQNDTIRLDKFSLSVGQNSPLAAAGVN
jgi:hypothetical protein